MAKNLIVGIDGTLIRKNGKGISRFLISFLEAFVLNPHKDIELAIFVDKRSDLPPMPKHSQIRYIPVKVIKQIIWDLWGFERSLKTTRCDIAFTLSDRVNISYKYLLYYFEVPDHRMASNRLNAGWYQRISDQMTRCFLKKTFAKADHIAVSSEFTKDDLLNLYNIPIDKISVIYPLAVDVFKASNGADKKQGIKEKYGAKDGYVLHFSSNNDLRDNTGTLLKAFALSLSRIPSGYKLVICGVDKLRSFGWGETLNKLGLETKVICTGFLSDDELLEVYQGADVYVDTSLYEGFGFQVAEAMACGVPVICPDGSSLPEVAGDAAVYIDQKNEKNIADVIVSALNDKNKMQVMSEKGIKQARKFTVGDTTKKIIKLIESIKK